jgi:hypothetical protein
MMPEEIVQRIDIGETGRKMVITKTIHGQLKSVEADDGKPAHMSKKGIRITNEIFDEYGSDGHFRADVTGMTDGSVIITHHNPTCCWYYSGGNWYWLCY